MSKKLSQKSRNINILESTIHLLHRAGQLADEEFSLAVRDKGSQEMTARQFIVMSAIANLENPSQTEICEQTGIDRSTLADIARRLVSRGLVARRRTRQDARMYAVRLTDAGEKALNEATAAAKTVEQSLLGVLSPAQRSDFETAMQQMVAKLQQKRSSQPGT